MAAEAWAINMLGIVFSIVAALFIIVKILPRVRDLVSSIVSDDTIVTSLMSLLVILVYVLLFIGIINLLKNIDNPFLNYVSVLDPGINLILAVLPYLKWLVFALALGLAFKYVKR
ncbi:MAG: hypothetical protein KKG75_04955 [Nanoarchaeota archaeon]|nr:hypothetical protein [Nanoarchaeota archaeon]